MSVRFVGATEMNGQEIETFQNLTKVWYEGFFQTSQLQRSLQQSETEQTGDVRNMTTQISVTGQVLSDSANTVTFDQTLEYLALEGALNADEYVVLPYLNTQSTREYAETLSAQIPAFKDVELPIGRPMLSTSEGDDGGESNFPIGLAIGIPVAAIATLVIALLVYGKYGRKPRNNSEAAPDTVIAIAVNDAYVAPENPTIAVDAHLEPAENPPLSVDAVLAVDADDGKHSSESKEEDGLPSFKDQVRSGPRPGGLAMQNAAIAGAQDEPSPLSQDGLPEFKDQVRSVARRDQKEVKPTAVAKPDT